MKFKLLIILAISFSKVNAQNFELGKVSITELEEKVHPIDTSAVAAILFNKGRTFFSYDTKTGFSINTEQVFRIKIYKKEGLKWANYKVPYYVGYEHYGDDKVEFTNCYSYNLENANVIISKLNSEGLFMTSKNKYWKEAVITMPNVKVGSIIEFKYIMKSENIFKFPDFNFQYDIPVNYSEYLTEIPICFVYKALLKGFLDIKTESKIASATINYNSKDGVLRSESISFEKVNSNYIAKNINALKTEPFVDNIQNYRSTLSHELEKTQFYQEPVKDYSVTWDGVAKTIYNTPEFGNEIKERTYIEEDLIKIIGDIDTEIEKTDAIFKFVQSKMNWNNQKGYYTDKGVKKSYIDGTGNIAEINFILISMLNAAGIKANPVLLSTIDNGIPQYPNRTIFNYVIAAVEIDDKQILLDATNKYTTLGIIPLDAINWTGRMLRQDGTSREISLIPNFLSKKGVFVSGSIDDKGKLSGQYRVQMSDYEAFKFREKYSEMNKDSYIEKIEENFPGLQISGYNLENNKNLSKPVIEDFVFTDDNQCEIIGDKMYINPKLFFTQTKNPFVQEKREFPIYFGCPTQEKYIFNIQIPEGYVVESVPKSIKLQTGESLSSFVFKSLITQNGFQISVTEESSKQIVSSDFYPDLKDFYQQMIDKQNEKIVLKKI